MQTASFWAKQGLSLRHSQERALRISLTGMTPKSKRASEGTCPGGGMVDALASGASIGNGCGGSSPLLGTKISLKLPINQANTVL